MAHLLVDIPREDWIQLRDLYKNKQKETSSFGLLHTIIGWIAKDPQLNIKIYSLNGDWKNDGTFVIIQTDFNPTHIFINTLNDDLTRLEAALNCLDLKSPYLIFGFSERVKAAVKAHFKYAGVDEEAFNPDATAWYNIEKDKALHFEAIPPCEYALKPLQQQHAEQVNSVWPHRAPNSIKFVETLIRLNDNVGLFDRDDKLIAWCLRLPIGSLGLLQVDDSYKRQGLGNLIVRHMAKLIASKGEEVLAPVVTTNTPSRSMFEKLGFSVISHVYWALKP